MENASSRPATSLPWGIIEMWIKSALFAFFLFDIFLIYLFFQQRAITLPILSATVAATGAMLIGLSFAVSNVSFYFPMFHAFTPYRKYLGLLGYYFALSYACLLLFVDPQTYFYGFWDNLLSLDILLGISALGILTFMATISNTWALKKLGPKHWRSFLRLGYVAYALLIIRAFVLEKELWTQWLQTLDTLPPLRLLVVVFASFVILLRLSTLFAHFVQKKDHVATSPSVHAAQTS